MHFPAEVEAGFASLPCDVSAFLTEHLFTEGDARVWFDQDDVLEYLKFSGLIGTEEEREVWLYWLQACDPGFWDDNSDWLSIDDDTIVSQEIVDELELIDMSYDFDEFVDESWKLKFRFTVYDEGLKMGGRYSYRSPVIISRETDHLSHREIGWPHADLPVGGELSAEMIKNVYNIELMGDAPCEITCIPPLRASGVCVSILKCVLDEDDNLAYIIGIWAGGTIFIPKTMATAIVRAQSRQRAPNYKYCEQQAMGRVSTDYHRTIEVSLYEKPEDVRFPWRAYWVNC